MEQERSESVGCKFCGHSFVSGFEFLKHKSSGICIQNQLNLKKEECVEQDDGAPNNNPFRNTDFIDYPKKHNYKDSRQRAEVKLNKPNHDESEFTASKSDVMMELETPPLKLKFKFSKSQISPWVQIVPALPASMPSTTVDEHGDKFECSQKAWIPDEICEKRLEAVSINSSESQVCKDTTKLENEFPDKVKALSSNIKNTYVESGHSSVLPNAKAVVSSKNSAMKKSYDTRMRGSSPDKRLLQKNQMLEKLTSRSNITGYLKRNLKKLTSKYRKCFVKSNEEILCPCQNCRIKIQGSSKLTQHLSLYHPRLKPFCCTECPYATNQEFLLSKHSKCHRLRKLFHCPACSATFGTHYSQASHIRTLHVELKNLLEEEVWKKEVSLEDVSTSDFSPMIGLTTTKIENPIFDRIKKEPIVKPCPHCPKLFTNNGLLVMHCRTKHGYPGPRPGPKPINPDHPRKRRSKPAFLKDHGQVYRTSPLNCSICFLEFSNLLDLELHCQNCRIQVSDPNSCTLCDQVIKSERDRVAHYLLRHPEAKPYKCPHCPYESKFKNQFHIHKKIHNELNGPYKCEKCNAFFAQSCARAAHMKVHGSGRITPKMEIEQRRMNLIQGIPKKCPHCPYTATKTYILRAHVDRMHTRASGSVFCPYCNAACNTNAGLKSHLRFAHQIDTINSIEPDRRQFAFKRRTPSFISKMVIPETVEHSSVSSKMKTINPIQSKLISIDLVETEKYQKPKQPDAEDLGTMGRNSTNVTIIHENKTGLKITTVRFS